MVDVKSKICVMGSKEKAKEKIKGFLARSFPLAWSDLKDNDYLASLEGGKHFLLSMTIAMI